LKGLISQVAGTDEDMTARIASTFSALVKVADLSPGSFTEGNADEQEERKSAPPLKLLPAEELSHQPSRRSPEFHYNIQVHLPANGSEETYLNIFTALRKTFV
jgi:hypothetical protein